MLIEDRVNERLRLLGKKKTWLLSIMGMAPATFWRKISGKSALTYDEMKQLAEELECSADYLAGLTDDPTPSEELPQERRGSSPSPSQATLDLEAIVRDLARERPDLGLAFRNARENWGELTDGDKRAIADILMFVFGKKVVDKAGKRPRGKTGS